MPGGKLGTRRSGRDQVDCKHVAQHKCMMQLLVTVVPTSLFLFHVSSSCRGHTFGYENS